MLSCLIAPAAVFAQTQNDIWTNFGETIDLQGLDGGEGVTTLINLGVSGRTGANLALNGRLTAPKFTTIDLSTIGGQGTITVQVVGDTCLQFVTVANPASALYEFPGYAALNDHLTITAENVRTNSTQSVQIFNQGNSAETDPANCNRNYGPVALSPTKAANEDQAGGVVVPFTDLAHDPDGDTLRFTPASGTVTGGSFTQQGTDLIFTPTANFNGQAVINYTAVDPSNVTDAGVLTINVAAVNDPPIANDGSASTNQGQPVSINVLQFVTDPDSTNFTVTVDVPPPANDGTAVAQANNTVLFTPGPNFVGPTTTFTYRATDDGQLSDTGIITVTVIPAGSNNAVPTARFVVVGAPSPRPDTDHLVGEDVPFDGSTSCPGAVDTSGNCTGDAGQVLTYQWTVGGAVQVSTSATPTFRLPDGTTRVSLVVTDNGAPVLSSTPAALDVVVQAARQTTAPVVSVEVQGGGTTQFSDTDGVPGERRTFTASATDPDNPAGQQNVAPSGFSWALLVGQTATPPVSGQGTAAATFDLPDGASTVRLIVTDDDQDQTTQLINVTVSAAPPPLTDAALTPNQRAVAAAIDTLCPRMGQIPTSQLTEGQQQLLGRCNSLKSASTTPDQQRTGLDAVGGQQVTASQTTGIDFSKVQLGNVGARLTALRQGAHGVSVAGLNVTHNGSTIPVAQLGEFVKSLLGGGAGDDEGRGLLDRRLGIFINGSIANGDKDSTANENGFDFDSKGITLGVDYRFTDQFVLGLAAGWNDADTDFNADDGSLDSKSITGTLYGTWYHDRFYLDFLASYGNVDYDSTRHVVYSDAGGSYDFTATGSTNGSSKSGGVSAGYGFGKGALLFTPTLALSYIRVDVDSFADHGTPGLDLVYSEQTAESFTATGGFSLAYNFSVSWGVITPAVRAAFVHEFKNDSQTVNVHFINDPFNGTPSGQDTDFVIITDSPDQDYLRWGVSLSAMFAHGISAFVDYESIAEMATISSQEFTAGMRFELKFH